MTTGVVTSVSPHNGSGTLTADVAIGATVLPLDDAEPFAEDFTEPRWLVIGSGGTPREYVATQNDEEDPAGESVTLRFELDADFERDLPVTPWDPTVVTDDKRGVTHQVWVRLDGQDGRPIRAIVPHEWIPVTGVDTLIGAGVELVEDPMTGWMVEKVFGRPAVVDGDTLLSVSIGQTDEDTISESFTGTSLPAGWTATKTGYDGTGSGAAGVPGASVTSTSTPAGTSGSALLIDFGPAGETTAGSAAGEVATSLPIAGSGRGKVRFRTAMLNGTTTPDDARLAIRRSDGTAWSSTEDSASMSLVASSDFTGSFFFYVYLTINGSDTFLGSVSTPVDPTTMYHFAELEDSGGMIRARVWPDDGTPQPDWMLAESYAGSTAPGVTSLIWQQASLFFATQGQKLWVDSFEATNYQTGFYVDPLGGGDWEAVRTRAVREALESVPRFEDGVTASGSISAVDTNKDVAVTFSKAFTSAPAVVMQADTNPQTAHVWPVSVTKTGFTARFRRSSGTASFNAYWHAAVRTV